MNWILFALLDANVGKELTHQLALDIVNAASRLEPLVAEEHIEKIIPEEKDGFVFAVERMEAIEGEMMPLHRAHWEETEAHRHALPFNPDYATFIRYERAGRYILFTLRHNGHLIGNCAMYLDRSTHTKTLIATEDTLYLLPQARKGNVAKHFIAYCETALKQLGVKEITVTVKTVNRAGLFFQRLGYRHVENGLTKVLEEKNHVPTESAEA